MLLYTFISTICFLLQFSKCETEIKENYVYFTLDEDSAYSKFYEVTGNIYALMPNYSVPERFENLQDIHALIDPNKRNSVERLIIQGFLIGMAHKNPDYLFNQFWIVSEVQRSQYSEKLSTFLTKLQNFDLNELITIVSHKTYIIQYFMANNDIEVNYGIDVNDYINAFMNGSKSTVKDVIDVINEVKESSKSNEKLFTFKNLKHYIADIIDKYADLRIEKLFIGISNTLNDNVKFNSASSAINNLAYWDFQPSTWHGTSLLIALSTNVNPLIKPSAVIIRDGGYRIKYIEYLFKYLKRILRSIKAHEGNRQKISSEIEQLKKLSETPYLTEMLSNIVKMYSYGNQTSIQNIDYFLSIDWIKRAKNMSDKSFRSNTKDSWYPHVIDLLTVLTRPKFDLNMLRTEYPTIRDLVDSLGLRAFEVRDLPSFIASVISGIRSSRDLPFRPKGLIVPFEHYLIYLQHNFMEALTLLGKMPKEKLHQWAKKTLGEALIGLAYFGEAVNDPRCLSKKICLLHNKPAPVRDVARFSAFVWGISEALRGRDLTEIAILFECISFTEPDNCIEELTKDCPDEVIKSLRGTVDDQKDAINAEINLDSGKIEKIGTEKNIEAASTHWEL